MNSFESQLEQLTALRTSGRLADAEQFARQLLCQPASTAEIWIEAAEIALVQGALGLAQKRLNTACLMDPRCEAAVLRTLARLHLRTGNLPAAGRCWWRRAQRTEDAQSWAGLLVVGLLTHRPMLQARARRALLRYPAAERQLKVAQLWLEARGGLIVASQTGRQHRRSALQQMLRSASRRLAAHARLHPQRADTHQHLAQVQWRLGDAEAAWLSATKATMLNPRYAAAKDLSHRIARAAARSHAA